MQTIQPALVFSKIHPSIVVAAAAACAVVVIVVIVEDDASARERERKRENIHQLLLSRVQDLLSVRSCQFNLLLVALRLLSDRRRRSGKSLPPDDPPGGRPLKCSALSDLIGQLRSQREQQSLVVAATAAAVATIGALSCLLRFVSTSPRSTREKLGQVRGGISWNSDERRSVRASAACKLGREQILRSSHPSSLTLELPPIAMSRALFSAKAC